jgi:phage shock protein PspC (stress-responsive transcriptional regulator)
MEGNMYQVDEPTMQTFAALMIGIGFISGNIAYIIADIMTNKTKKPAASHRRK